MKSLGPCGTCWHWKETGETVADSFEAHLAARNIARETQGRPRLTRTEADNLQARHVPGRLGHCERRLHSRGMKRHQPLMIEHSGCGEWTPMPAPEHLPASCLECRFLVPIQRDDATTLPEDAGMCTAFASLRDASSWHPRPAETVFVFPYTESNWRCGDGVSKGYEEDQF